MHRLWDLSIPILVHVLTSPDVPAADKLAIALELVKKMCPAHLDLKDKGLSDTRIIIHRPCQHDSEKNGELTNRIVITRPEPNGH